MIHWLYDIESTPNYFLATFLSADTDKTLIARYIDADIKGDVALRDSLKLQMKPVVFEVSEHVNQYGLLVIWLRDYKTLISYNGKHYDDWIIASCITAYNSWKTKDSATITKSLYDITHNIINREFYAESVLNSDAYLRMAKETFDSIDLMKLHYLDHYFVSLKQVAIHLKWYNILDYVPQAPTREECVKYYGHSNVDYVMSLSPFDRKTTSSSIPHMKYYNFNDVLMLHALYWHGVKELVIRYGLKQTFDVKAYSASRSTMANILMSKFYAERTNQNKKDFIDQRTQRFILIFNELLSPKIKFNSNELNAFLSKVRATKFRIGHDKFYYTVPFNGKKYTLALGGIHSQDRPMYYETNDKYIIRDADVTSFYPSIILNMGIYPAHLVGSVFLKIFRWIVEERIAAKKTNKMKAEVLKIVINVVYGKFNDEYSWMKDPKCTYKTTLNGQLFLLMLIEMLEEKGIQVISANTDGITSKIPRELEQVYIDTCKEWEQITKFNLEYANYDKYIRTTVNDYIAYVNEGDGKHKIKAKGDFLYDSSVYNKGFMHPVVCKAIEAHFIKGQDVREFIKNHTDIYDFCMSQKIGKAYAAETHSIDPWEGDLNIESVSKNLRFYVTTSGEALLKRNKENDNLISIISGKYIRMLNRYEDLPIADYKIDYAFYITRAYKLINQITNLTLGNKTVGKKKIKVKDIRGGMFDEHFNI